MKRLGYTAIAALLGILALTVAASFGHTYSSGAPSGYSGPERTCRTCHSVHPDSNQTGTG